MNMTCYAVIFVDKSDFRAKVLGLYSEGPMTITYDHGHESAAELFRIERWNHAYPVDALGRYRR